MGKIKYLIFSLGFFILLTTTVDAASASISISNDNITPGTSVKVTSTISSSNSIFFIEGTLKCSGAGVNNQIDLNFETMENNKKSDSKSLTVKPTSVGTIKCTINGKIMDSSSSNWVNVSSSKNINVVKPREKSTNNNLKSLSVEGYELSPSFDKNVLEYTVNLESNVEKITINASKEDGYASLNGTGEKEVQEGDNNFEITVTSETGASKVYKINAIVKDSNPIKQTIDGKEYTVIKRASTLEKPENFEETTVTIENIEIPAFYNEKANITLIGLKDEEGNNYLFRYNSKDNTYIKYQFLTSISQTIVFEDSQEKISNYEKKEVTIDNQKYTVYQNSKDKDYLLIYGMNLETGNKNWYLYNMKEKSIQTYMKDIMDDMNQSFDNKVKEYKVVLLGMAGLSLFLLCIIIIEIISKNKMKKKYLQKIQDMKESKKEIKEDSKEEKTEQEKIKEKEKKKNKKQKIDEDLW